jgi:hypothetical protein
MEILAQEIKESIQFQEQDENMKAGSVINKNLLRLIVIIGTNYLDNGHFSLQYFNEHVRT